MTRKEQIEKARWTLMIPQSKAIIFEAGAEWADQNPTEQNIAKHLVYHHFQCEIKIGQLEQKLAIAVEELKQVEGYFTKNWAYDLDGPTKALAKIEAVK